jgi:hypothetical protein
MFAVTISGPGAMTVIEQFTIGRGNHPVVKSLFRVPGDADAALLAAISDRRSDASAPSGS